MSIVKNYINTMITNGKKSYYDLSPDEKEFLTAIYMEEFVEQPDYLLDSDNYELIQSILCHYLKNPINENRDLFAENMKDHTVKHYKDKLIELFEEAYERYYAENKRNNGFFPMVNKINGEIIWVRQ